MGKYNTCCPDSSETKRASFGHLVHFSNNRVEKFGSSSQQVKDPSSGQFNLKQHAWPNNLTTNYSASVMLLRTRKV